MSKDATLMVLLAIAAALVLLNAYATIRLLRSDVLGRHRFVAQCSFIWVVPFAGALLVLHLLSESTRQDLEAAWSPQTHINPQVDQVLRATARRGARAARSEVEASLMEGDHHSGGTAESSD